MKKRPGAKTCQDPRPLASKQSSALSKLSSPSLRTNNSTPHWASSNATRPSSIASLLARAEAAECGLVVHGVVANEACGWLYSVTADAFRGDRDDDGIGDRDELDASRDPTNADAALP